MAEASSSSSPAEQKYAEVARATVVTSGPGFVEIVPSEGYLPWGKLPETVIDPEKDTLFHVYQKSYEKFAEKDCLGTRTRVGKEYGKYTWISYAELGRRAAALGSAFARLGVAPKECCAIFANNCAEWHVSEHAMIRQNLVSVPLYATFGVQSIAYILRQAQLHVAICQAELLNTLLESAALAEGVMRNVIFFSLADENWAPTDELRAKAAAAHIELLSWKDAMELGAKNPAEPVAPSPDDIFTIIYTSGTTGDPKGVVMNHRNGSAITNLILNTRHFRGGDVTEEVHISYLPLAHSFERQFTLSIIRGGGCIGYFSGSVPRLFEDIAELKPTYMLGVPRVWKRLYDKAQQTISESGFIKRTLFNYALGVKTAIEEEGSWSWFNWDNIVFKNMQAKLGGRCRQIINGGAALSGELNAWLNRVFLVDCCQGYGLTECFGGIVIQTPPDQARTHRHSIGMPQNTVQVRLVDVPEMEYMSTSNPPRGEIWLRSPTVFQGYYMDPQKTAETRTEDGWLKTGDIGELLDDGCICIIDRKKNLFKLAQGEYVAAEYLETLFSKSPLFAQVWVHGEPTDTFIVAVCTVNGDTLATVAERELGIKAPNLKELCANKAVVDYALKEIQKLAKDQKLPGFQVPRALYLEPEAFTVENDLCTPTFKLKRPLLKQRYAAQLKEISEPVRAAENAKSS